MKRLILTLLLVGCGATEPRSLPLVDPDASVSIDGALPSSDGGPAADGGVVDGGPFAMCPQPCRGLLSTCGICNGVAACVAPEPYCRLTMIGTNGDGAFETTGCTDGECTFEVEARDTGLYFKIAAAFTRPDKTSAWFSTGALDFGRLNSGVEFEITGDNVGFNVGGCGPQSGSSAKFTWTATTTGPWPAEGTWFTAEIRSPLCHPDNDRGEVVARAEALFFMPE